MLDYREHAPGEAQSGTVIMLHGFGANAADLYSLHGVVDPASQHRWVFPEAPYRSLMLGGGQAWFPRDEDNIMNAMSGEYFKDMSNMDPDDLRQSAAEILELAAALELDWSRTILAGFSQGAMVATECVVGSGTRPAGLALFSGVVVAADRWRSSVADRAAGLPVYHSHGEYDPILSFEAGTALAQFLSTAGADLRSTTFPGGHTIPEAAVEGFTGFVQELLG
ncbi:MAG: hypothetical protein EA428_13090 [Spirochaetaceae bacterium]|nr:MAG: hypothetical protein EA428_13090 [Spirochaetaceae bacterium]